MQFAAELPVKYKWQCLNNRNLIHCGFCALEIETTQCPYERDEG